MRKFETYADIQKLDAEHQRRLSELRAILETEMNNAKAELMRNVRQREQVSA
jgi:hypothetical protein